MIRNLSLHAALGAAVSLLSPALGAAALAQSKDFVYVETNLKPANSIRAFERARSGRLREISGSPFATGGAGSGYNGTAVGPDDSDQEIVTNQDHSLLFAINAGSDSIAVLRIQDNGALAAVPGSPFPSGGNDPVSLDISGDLLLIANKAGDPNRPTTRLPNYTALRILGNGSLVPTGETTNDTSRLFDSTVSVAVGSSPDQVHAIPGTDLVFGDDLLGQLLQRFRFNAEGSLHQLSPIALPASIFPDTSTPRSPQGLWNHPTEPYLYVGAPLGNLLVVYRYGYFGALSFVRALPAQGSAICWLRTNRAGTRLYTTETGSNSVGVYDTTDPANPVQLQELTLAGVGNAFQLTLSPDDRNLYVLSPRAVPNIPLGQGNVLHSLTIGDDGRLSETLPLVPFSSPTNARPRGLVDISVR